MKTEKCISIGHHADSYMKYTIYDADELKKSSY